MKKLIVLAALTVGLSANAGGFYDFPQPGMDCYEVADSVYACFDKEKKSELKGY